MISEVYNEDCNIGLARIPDNSIEIILTDPPYKYLNNQKLEVDFDETVFFDHVKRVLKKDGFIVMFGRGTSFYRWNTMLADRGFQFKEEIVWDKSQCSSPLMNLSRVHETVSLHSRKGSINKVKVPYLEMKRDDVPGVLQDLKRMTEILRHPKSLKAVQDFLLNNQFTKESECSEGITIRKGIDKENRACSEMRKIEQGMNERTIIRTDYEKSSTMFKKNLTGSNDTAATGNRACNVAQSIHVGLNEKSIIKQVRNHYSAIHPTQKPVRLLERLLALVMKNGGVLA